MKRPRMAPKTKFKPRGGSSGGSDFQRGSGGSSGGSSGSSSSGSRMRPRKKLIKFTLPKDTKIEYKNLSLLQRYITERGKIVSRRLSGISAKEQRAMSLAIKRARFLGLLSVGSSKKH